MWKGGSPVTSLQPEQPRRKSPATLLIVILMVAALCYLVVSAVSAGFLRVISVVPDDASYFLEVAQNIAAGEGSSFDGIHRTNGLQPLWTYALAGLFTIVTGTPESLLRVVLVIQALLLALAGVVVLRVQSKFYEARVGVVACLLFILLVQIPGTTGMESALLMLSLSVLLGLGVSWRVFDEHRPRREFVFGLALGAAMLSRLDAVFLGAAICAACLPGIRAGSRARRTALVRLAMIVLGASVVVAPYLAHNLLLFGHPVPISGVLKSSFPHAELTPHVLAHLGPLKAGAALTAVAAAVLYLVWFVRLRRGGRRSGSTDGESLYHSALAVMAASILIHFPYSLLFMKWTEAWYFTQYGLFLTLAVGPLVAWFLSPGSSLVRRWVYRAGATALFLCGLLAVADRATRPLDSCWHVVSYEAAVWARENTDETDIFSMANAGHFGFFSERRVVNLDGLVGTFDFQNVLRERRLNAFLSDRNVDYLVEHTFSDREDNDVLVAGGYGAITLPFRSLRYDVWADEVPVREEDEIFRSSPYWERGRSTVLIIWRLRHHGDVHGASRPPGVFSR